MEVWGGTCRTPYTVLRESVSLVFRVLSVVMFLMIGPGPCGTSDGHIISIALAILYVPVVWDEDNRTAWRVFMPLACFAAVDEAMTTMHGYQNLGLGAHGIPPWVMFAVPLTVLVVTTVATCFQRSARRVRSGVRAGRQ